MVILFLWMTSKYGTLCREAVSKQARRMGGLRGWNELPLEVNIAGLKTQTVDFQHLGKSGGM